MEATLSIFNGPEKPKPTEFRLRLVAAANIPKGDRLPGSYSATSNPKSVSLCNVDAAGNVIDILAIYEVSFDGKLKQIRISPMPEDRYVRDVHGHISC